MCKTMSPKGKKLNCDNCGYECVSKSSLIKHIKNKHNKKSSDVSIRRNKNCRCPNCQAAESGDKKIINSKGKTFRHNCHYENCDKLFESATHLEIHIRSHTGERPFVCDFKKCRKKFYSKAMLKTHKMSHSEEKKFHCDICDERYRMKSSLLNHIIAHNKHGPEFKLRRKKCKCSYCQHEASGGQKVVDDAGRRLHICDYPKCSKIYVKGSYLKEHLRTHTDDRRFGCNWPDCDRRFYSKGNLNKHLRLHTELQQKIYKCYMCSYKSATTDDLQAHIEVHFQLQNLRCNVQEIELVSDEAQGSNTTPWRFEEPENESQVDQQNQDQTEHQDLQDLERFLPDDLEAAGEEIKIEIEEIEIEIEEIEIEIEEVKVEPETQDAENQPQEQSELELFNNFKVEPKEEPQEQLD